MWEKVLESVLLKYCLLLFQQNVSVGGLEVRGDRGPGETFLESDEPVGTQDRVTQRPILHAGRHSLKHLTDLVDLT